MVEIGYILLFHYSLHLVRKETHGLLRSLWSLELASSAGPDVQQWHFRKCLLRKTLVVGTWGHNESLAKRKMNNNSCGAGLPLSRHRCVESALQPGLRCDCLLHFDELQAPLLISVVATSPVDLHQLLWWPNGTDGLCPFILSRHGFNWPAGCARPVRLTAAVNGPYVAMGSCRLWNAQGHRPNSLGRESFHKDGWGLWRTYSQQSSFAKTSGRKGSG